MRSGAELRDAIVAAARTEFAQHGLAGARIDRIARTAHASKERLYAHFGDKQTLFRTVVAMDTAEFFCSLAVRPDAVAEIVGDIYDYALQQPDRVRMNDWARLEGVRLDEPLTDGEPAVDRAIAAIKKAQEDGFADTTWQPVDLLIMLFGIGLAWAHSPDPRASADNPATIASRRAAAIEAATRVVMPAPRPGRHADPRGAERQS